jgi:NADH:ubiquinone oxidoreductase subunit 3 (subunit A)
LNKKEIECGIFGFSNKSSNSFNYILFLIIFLIFDLEIILIFPQLIKNLNFLFFFIILFILIRLLLELYEISLKWND